jgi:FkbM family methyltransferase
MHYSVILIGAHTGSKTEGLITAAVQSGPAILVEPVPSLYKKLVERHIGRPQVTCINEVISSKDGEVDFSIISEDGFCIDKAADQFGSLKNTHATDHRPELKPFLKTIKCRSRTMSTLLKDFNVRTLDALITDMEGSDVPTLMNFPFYQVRPYQILFEVKHSDGTMQVGKNLATLLLFLEAMRYRISLSGSENMIAVDQSPDAKKPSLLITI